MEKYRDIANSGFDWVWEVDSTGTFVFVSPAVQDVMGYSPDELFGKTPFDFMKDEEAARVVSVYSRVASLNDGFRNLVNTCITKSGDEVVISTSGVPVFDADGKLKGYRGGDRNITEEVKTADQLKRALDTTKLILENLPVGVVLVDRNKRIKQMNHIASAIIGRKQDELIGKRCSAAMCPSLANRCPIIDMNQRIDRDEHFVVHKDGHRIPVIKSVIPIQLDLEQLLLEVLIDVSEVKTLRKDLSEQNSVLRREIDTLKKNAEKIEQHRLKRRRIMGRFITDKIASLCGITGIVDILLEQKQSSAQRDLLVSVQSDYRELINSVRLIQDTMAVEQRALPVDSNEFLVSKLFSLAVSAFAASAEENGIDIHVSIDPLLPEMFLGPARGIEGVLQVMLGLALARPSVKAIETGVTQMSASGRRVEVRFYAGFPEDGFIPTETANLASERFRKPGIDRVSVCREFAAACGGEFGWRGTATGSGSAFWLTIPLEPCENIILESETIPKGTRVLVIESSRHLRNTYQRMLQSMGCKVKAVSGRSSALEELIKSNRQGSPFKIIVLNGDSEQEEGMITASVIRSSGADDCRVQIIICSSTIGADDMERFQKQGYAAVLRKPLVLSTMRNCVTTLLNRTTENPRIVTEYSLP
jgi:PAS domain S-box-containing protein